MHEFSIVQALMQQVEAQAAARRATRVTRIEVRIGEQSGVDPHLLDRAYGVYRRGTIAERAPLAMTVVPVRWDCPRCGAAIPAGTRLTCRSCGAPARLIEGDELLLDRIEMEVA